MRENKLAIILTFILFCVSLFISILFQIISSTYVSTIFAGICSSSFLALVIAAINYLVARRRTLEKFYCYALKVVANFNKFDNSGDLERAIDSVLIMNQFDYYEIDNAFGDMNFLFNNERTLTYIFKNIYEPILRLRDLITVKSFHFREYRKTEHGNKLVMKDFISDIDSVIMKRKEYELQTETGSVKCSASENGFVKMLKDELGGRYYDLMYLKKHGSRVKVEQ